MDFNDFKIVVESALKTNNSVVFAANCEVNYSGRAESYLASGDRIIMIKPDKTLIVHQSAGSAPVNYMKEGTSHTIVLDKELLLQSQNLALKEFMEIRIHRVYFLNTHNLNDTQKIQLAGSEKDMAEMLYNNPEMVEKGFKPLSMEEHTAVGFIDIFGYDKDNILVVVECKRYQADFNAVQQLQRYIEKIKKLKGLKEVRGILACPKISFNARRHLTGSGFKWVEVRPPKYLEKYDKGQATLGSF